MPSIEQLAPIIIDTLTDSIEFQAREIISQGELTNVQESDIIDSIKSYRRTRKGLEQCCQTLMAIYRRKNMEVDLPNLRDESDWSSILGSNPFYKFKP